MKETEKISFPESLKLNLRAFRVMYKASPKLVLSYILHSFFTAAFVYVPIRFSALVISALEAGDPPEKIRLLVILTILVTAAGGVISAFLSRFRSVYMDEGAYPVIDKIWQEKALSMDFVVADDPKTQALMTEIRQFTNGGGYGIWRFLRLLESFTKAVASTLGGIVLTVTMFTSRVTDPKTAVFLNHPLVTLLAAAAFILIALLTQKIAVWAEEYWYKNADEHSAGNRLFGHFGFMGMSRDRALDMRIYNEYPFCERWIGDKTQIFSSKGPFAILSRGRVGRMMALSAALSMILTGFVTAYVGLKALGGAFGIGLVTQYTASAVMLFVGLSESAGILGNMKANAFFLKKNFDYIDLPDPMYQGTLTIEKRRDRNYEIEFKDVSFKYPGADTFALKNVSFRFRIGQRLAIVGENGSGKTTFIKLLARLYDPTEGEILLNGIDIRKYDYKEYLSVFSVVFQDFSLPALKLGEVVASSSDYDRKRAEDALERAGFSERLSELPSGLDTFIGKDYDVSGVDFSGGEKQKIAIARAIYRDASFMILDEPTAALDPKAEAEVYRRFDEIAEDRTTVFISHRLSSCRFCDEIAVFSEGKIIQNGTHESLLSDAGGKYAALWNAQAQWYTE